MKKLMVALLVALTVFGMTSCGKEKAAEGPKDTKGEQLIIYSNSVSDGRGDWLVERARQDGFNIQYVDAGGGDIMNRLIAEKNSPIADVCFGLNTIMWETLKSQDILVPFTPEWAGEISEGLNDPEGYYHAIVKQGILLAYDLNQWSEEEGPKDWPDLWHDPKFSKTYEIRTDLGGGTVRNVIAGILSRYLDPNGYLGVSEEGWNEIKMYYDNGSPETGVDVYARIADPNDTVQCGQMWSSGVEARDAQYGTRTKYVVPECGIPYAVEAVSLIKGTKHQAEAERFINWFGSAEIQAEWAKQFSTLPANEKAVSVANAFNQELAGVKAQDIDWKIVATNIDKWCEEIQLNYLP